MKIKGAIFDCDGTLVDSLGFWELFYEKLGEMYFGDKSFVFAPEDDKAVRTQPIGFLSKIMHEKYGIESSAQAAADMCLRTFDWYYREVAELKAGVKELLAALKSRGVRMCIASAAEPELIKLILGRHGVLDYFDSIISCTEVGAGKDKPDVFLAAEKFLGTPHAETWIFEDSLLAIETSKKADFKVVGVYDVHTFGQDRARELSDQYIEGGESFSKLIPLLDSDL